MAKKAGSSRKADPKPKTDRQGRIILPAVQAKPPAFRPERGHVPFGAKAAPPAGRPSTRARVADAARAAVPNALRPGRGASNALSGILGRGKKK